MSEILISHLKTAVFDLLDETFEKVHGYYLDRNTSLFETLATISAEEASRPVSESGASIAGHVEHLRFYLDVLEQSLRGQEIGKIDWEQSWLVHAVTPDEWSQLQNRTREGYQRIRALAEGFETWEGEQDIPDTFAVIVHTAYHLGAIRLALYTVRQATR